MFKLVNSIFREPILPDSRYTTDKLLNQNTGVQFHAVCHNCKAYIGKFEEVNSITVCNVCQKDLDLANPSNTSFFVIIDPSTQVSDLLRIHGKEYNYITRERQREDGHLKDVYDGNAYQNFLNSLPQEDRYNYVTTILNTDGAAKFKSSQFSVWPIYLMINELPIQLRMNNLITCGLWCHKNKPEMNTFLDPLVDIVNNLSSKGIQCEIEGQERLIKLYVTACCVDTIARAPVQGIKQFNGHFGCNWCLHPGIYSDRSMRYPLQETPPDTRDDDITVQEMLRANPQNPVNGIRHASALINLDHFKIISGFVPDYLHCVLEGVAKQFTEYYIEMFVDNTLNKFRV